MLTFPAFSEPSRTTTYLMAEPVSLFDHGLKRLGEKANNVLGKSDFPEVIGNLSTSIKGETVASYDLKSNRITLYGAVQQNVSSANPATLLNLCGRVVERLRFIFGYGEMGANYRKLGLMQGVAPNFQHRGYQKKDEPANLEDDLANMITIRIIAFANKDDKIGLYGNSVQITCVGNLSDSEINTVSSK